MPERIFVDEDGKEIRREPMKRGRPPKGSHKDSKGNLICPPIEAPKKKDQPVKKAKETVFKAPDTVDSMTTRGAQEIQEAYRMTLDEFTSGLFICSNTPMEKRGEILVYHGVYFKFHLYLKKCHTDLFNSIAPLMTVDPINNIINIWGWYGPKKEDEQGNVYYDFDAVAPKYVIKGLFRPDE